MVSIALVGKTNTGKTTFFNAATLLNAEIASYPFTTKAPERGIAYVTSQCVCVEFGVKDNPRNSACIDGWRFIPIELMDLPGLIKGAWTGRGLGNQFLQAAVMADALLHVVDASGSINEDGEIVKPGIGDPVRDVYDIEEEVVLWFAHVLNANRAKVSKLIASNKRVEDALYQVLSGLKVRPQDVARALKEAELEGVDFKGWGWDDIKRFSQCLRTVSKPTVIVANKMDLPYAEENYRRLVEEFRHTTVIPCSAEAELILRRAEQRGFIKYVPGGEMFKVVDESKLTDKQRWALEYVERRVINKYFRTGVQFALNFAVFKLLGMNVVYPVEDEGKLADSKGNVLPDALLLPPGSTATDLAREIHSELAKSMLYAIDVRTGLRVPKDYVVRDRDVIKVVTARRK
ncbi:MAG: redox-regulated ATPase YchF [Candidatus Nezhaarchaeota archaeon]|nr:redox-regulated ATPase YchF [Candidatus Nezhaarchaeota archaeon]